MLFSIITVCYNSEKTIEKTIKSVLNQTEKDYEYIIIDGGSKDRTLDIVKTYENAFDGKLKYISEKDNGIYDAMNKGIAMAEGEIIGLVNSDDYYEPDALENVKKEYERLDEKDRKHLVMYGFMRTVNGGKEIAIEFYHHDNMNNQIILHPTCFVSKRVYEDFGVFDTKYRSAADLDLMMRLYHKTDTIFVPIYKVISNFEKGGMSGSPIGQKEVAKIKYEYGLIPKSRVHYENIHACIVGIYRKYFKK